MKTYSAFVKIGLIGFLFTVLITCKKETPKVLPNIAASEVTNITANSATAGGTVSTDGGDPVTARGVCWSSTIANPTVLDSKTSDGTGLGIFTSSITGLKAGTTYNIRAYATNYVGTAYYSQAAFKTKDLALATVTTSPITSITIISAIGGGEVVSDGYSQIIARGVCWSVNPNPIFNPNFSSIEGQTSSGEGLGGFSSSIKDLRNNTKYYVRSYAENGTGISYGTQTSFTTLSSSAGTVSDVDGNIYNTIMVGSQVWFKENLRTTKFNDYSPKINDKLTFIPNVTNNTEWGKLTTPAYCWYNNDVSYKGSYGALYNWFAVNTGKLCPTGWHVSSDDDWKALSAYLGDDSGNKVREIGMSHWSFTGGTDLIGFTALPGGMRNDYTGIFTDIQNYGFFWITGNITDYYVSSQLGRDTYAIKQVGESIRCVKN